MIGRTDVETPILWLSDSKSQLIGKDPDTGKDRGQEKKGAIEDEMVGWHHQLNGHEFVQTLRDGERQGSLVCCSPWGCKESDMTELLNNKKNCWQWQMSLRIVHGESVSKLRFWFNFMPFSQNTTLGSLKMCIK